MLAAGVYDLHLTPAEFSSLTPRHIDAMFKRHLAAEERQTYRIRELILVYLNSHRDSAKHPEAFTYDELFKAQQNGLAAHAEAQMASLEEFSRKAIEHGARPPLRKWTPNA